MSRADEMSGPLPSRWASNVEALRSAQKPSVGVPFYLRWVNRPLGRRAAATAEVMGMSPNQVTAVSALVSLAGIAVLVGITAPWAGSLAAVLLLVGYVLDSADGQLARLQGSGGPAGEWLDHVVDGMRAPLVHVAIAVHLHRTGAPAWAVVVALVFSVLVSGWFLARVLAEKLAPETSSTTIGSVRGWVDALVKQPQDPSTTYLLLVVTMVPVVFVVAYTALFVWHLLICAGSLWRKHRQLQRVRR